MSFNVIIYCHGVSNNIDAGGGIGAVLECNGVTKEIKRPFMMDTSRAEVEMAAIIKSLEAITKPSHISIYLDSKHLVRAINEKWVDHWRENDWLKQDGEPVKNQFLWEKIDELIKGHKSVGCRWSHGIDNPLKHRAEELAMQALQEAKTRL